MRHHKGATIMTAFRTQMNRILQEQEDGIIITNPKDRVRTFFRKVAYRFAVCTDWVRRTFTRRPDGDHR
jgi:hypothetical protein